MNVRVNGELVQVPDGVSLAELLAYLETQGPVATEVNGTFVPRPVRNALQLQDQDSIRIIPIVMGG